MNVTACLCWFKPHEPNAAEPQSPSVLLVGLWCPSCHQSACRCWDVFLEVYEIKMATREPEGRTWLSVQAVSSDAAHLQLHPGGMWLRNASPPYQLAVDTDTENQRRHLHQRSPVDPQLCYLRPCIWLLCPLSDWQRHPEQTLISGCWWHFALQTSLLWPFRRPDKWRSRAWRASPSIFPSFFWLRHWSFALNWTVILILSSALPEIPQFKATVEGN